MKLTFLFIPALVVSMIFAVVSSFVQEEGTPKTSRNAYTHANISEVRQIVETFFEGFHAQDSMTIRKAVHEEVRMQSIGKNRTGKVKLSNQDFNEFLVAICSIPETTSFKEVIHNYEVKMDGKMANVWTPYTFYINDDISHCGTNSFQLFKRDGVWKIFYIVDTRDRESCGIKRG